MLYKSIALDLKFTKTRLTIYINVFGNKVLDFFVIFGVFIFSGSNENGRK